MMSASYYIVPYERKHREALLNLMFYSSYTHQHLDWYKAGQWLDLERSIVHILYEENEGLRGFIGVSEPLNGTTWVRLIALESYLKPRELFHQLWQSIETALREAGVHTVAILVMNAWLQEEIEEEGFQFQEDVVTLQRVGIELPTVNESPVIVRSAYQEELDSIMAIDHAAFTPPWQMSYEDLWQAQRQSASSTIAEIYGEPVGYQISTRHHASGHLARLAVHPDYQGQGVGAHLLQQLIDRFVHRGVRMVTVNTQAHNIVSQRLYKHFGFRRNGFDLPVWMKQL